MAFVTEPLISTNGPHGNFRIWPQEDLIQIILHCVLSRSNQYFSEKIRQNLNVRPEINLLIAIESTFLEVMGVTYFHIEKIR